MSRVQRSVPVAPQSSCEPKFRALMRLAKKKLDYACDGQEPSSQGTFNIMGYQNHHLNPKSHYQPSAAESSPHHKTEVTFHYTSAHRTSHHHTDRSVMPHWGWSSLWCDIYLSLSLSLFSSDICFHFLLLELHPLIVCRTLRMSEKETPSHSLTGSTRKVVAGGWVVCTDDALTKCIGSTGSALTSEPSDCKLERIS